jgi:hypothetical protein
VASGEHVHEQQRQQYTVDGHGSVKNMEVGEQKDPCYCYSGDDHILCELGSAGKGCA